MGRLDDVQAAHDTIRDVFPEMVFTHGPVAVEHAAVPGLLAIARAAQETLDDYAYSPVRTQARARLRAALAEFEAGP